MTYKPNHRTLQVLSILGQLANALDRKFYYAVMGGMAVDGFVGKLTRDHGDADLLVFRENLTSAESALGSLGFNTQKFGHPKAKDFIYKMQTAGSNHELSFQILDKVGKDFEISFFNFLKLRFPISQIDPPVYLTLEGVTFPAVSKSFLVNLKHLQVDFYEKLKISSPDKYQKRQEKHLKCLHDLDVLK